MIAAVAPAKVEFPEVAGTEYLVTRSGGRGKGEEGGVRTFEDGGHGGEVGADGHDDHGGCEGEELDDDMSGGERQFRWCEIKRGTAKVGPPGGGLYVGTAGLMSDFWLAAGLEPVGSSWSRMVFSVEMILREAILIYVSGEIGFVGTEKADVRLGKVVGHCS